MSKKDHENYQVVDRFDTGTNIWYVIIVTLVIVATIGVFTIVAKEDVLYYVKIGVVSMAGFGLFGIFALALGVISFSGKSDGGDITKAVVDRLRDGALITDKAGRIIYANNRYLELTGAQNVRDVRSLERVFAQAPQVSDALHRLNLAVFEQRYWSEHVRVPPSVIKLKESSAKDPSAPEFRWLKISVNPVLIGNQRKAQLFLWLVADISRDKQRQDNAIQNLQQAIDDLDHAPVGFFSMEGSGRIRYINATLANWLGLDLAEINEGSLMLQDFTQAGGSNLVQGLEIKPGSISEKVIDIDFRKADGGSLPVRLLHQVPYALDGSVGASRTVVLNRESGEDVPADLRAAEVRFARFFNNTPIGIATVDAAGKIIRNNAPFAKLTAAIPRQQETNGIQSIFQIAKAGQDDVIKAVLDQAHEKKADIKPVEIDLSGEGFRSARLYACAVDDVHDGETAIVYASETTEQRSLEAQFAQSQKMQAVGKLAGGIAHDFNNVLTAIIGFSDLLLANHRTNDPSFQDIMNIKQNANRAAGLVRQLLAYSRQQTLQPKNIRVNEVVADTYTMLMPLVGEKAKLDVEYGRDLWEIKADANQLEQVIVNLVVNARDAMVSLGGKIIIRTKNISKEKSKEYKYRGMVQGDYVLIEVEDNGSGMTQEVIDKIFEPFFSTKDVGKGTGLGLSTVYGIVKQSGGFIYPESTVGQGTLFRIFFPKVEAMVEPKDMAGVQPAKPVIQDLTGEGTILLVEDEESVRAFSERALISRGYTVLTASKGEDALEIMKQHKDEIRLVISDVVMPEMDGPTLLKKLRQLKKDFKIIFVSGYAEDAFSKNLDEAETFYFLPKPFSLKQLVTKVKSAFEAKSS